jgi:hypothetical protein
MLCVLSGFPFHPLRLLGTVKNATMLFYQTHSIGQLLNIFTFDVDKVDLMVPKDVCER